MNKRIMSAVFAAMLFFRGTAGAEVICALADKTRLYENPTEQTVTLLLPKGAVVELIREEGRRICIRIGPLGGWIDAESVREDELEELRSQLTVSEETDETEEGNPGEADTSEESGEQTEPAGEIEETDGNGTDDEMNGTGEIPGDGQEEQNSGGSEEENQPEETDPDEEEKSGQNDGERTELQMNDHGEDVRQLQEALIRIGYDIGEADGYYGKKTMNAVVSLQLRYGIRSDGIAGEETLELVRALTGENGEPVYEAPLKYSYTMRKGKKGKTVRLLQEALVELGYLESEGVNGRYNDATVEAVMRFQTDAGLTVDGIAGEETVNLLSATLLAQRLALENDAQTGTGR